MTNIVPISQAKMPAAMRDRMNSGAAVTKNFEEGVRDSFPLLSIKGKVFRIRISGQETPLIDQQTRQVIPALDVVMINAGPQLAKSYYEKGFEEGEFNQPDCWSMDSVKPDPMVPNKVSPTCINCPKNVFGSAPSRDATQGKRGGKACQDARRVAVMMPGHLELEEPLVFMLRVPATSLKNLKAFAQLLERQGWEPAACVTRLSFDYQEAYPKLLFNFVDGLNDAEYAKVVDIAESKLVEDMLRAPDFDVAVSDEPKQEDRVEPRVRQAAPVMETDIRQGAPAQQAAAETQQTKPETQQAKPDLHAVPDDPNIIELPDGQWFDQTTGEYITRPEPKVDMPANDPNVIPLPQGKFFNKATGKYVAGPEIGAKVIEEPAVAAPAPEKKARPSRAKAKETPPNQQAAAAQQAATAAQTPAQQAAAATGNGAAKDNPPQKVAAAPAALDDLIRSVFPSVKS